MGKISDLKMILKDDGMCYIVRKNGDAVMGVNNFMFNEHKMLMVVCGKKEDNYAVKINGEYEEVEFETINLFSVIIICMRGIMYNDLLDKKKHGKWQQGFYMNDRCWKRCLIRMYMKNGENVYSIKGESGEEGEAIYLNEIEYLFVTMDVSGIMARALGVKWEELMLFLQESAVDGMEAAKEREEKDGE